MIPRVPLAVLGALAVLACSDSTGPSETITLAKLAGTWELDSINIVLASDSSVISTQAAGIEATLSISRDGTTSLHVSVSGEPVAVVFGTIALHGDTIVYHAEGSGSDYVATVKLAGSRMTWLSVETYLYDMDGDGTPEEAFERDVWQRQ